MKKLYFLMSIIFILLSSLTYSGLTDSLINSKESYVITSETKTNFNVNSTIKQIIHTSSFGGEVILNLTPRIFNPSENYNKSSFLKEINNIPVYAYEETLNNIKVTNDLTYPMGTLVCLGLKYANNPVLSCDNFNFVKETCTDKWVKEKISLDNNGCFIPLHWSGYTTTSVTGYLLHNETDSQFTNYRKLLNRTSDTAMVTFNGINLSNSGYQCSTYNFTSQNSTHFTRVNGTWTFGIYWYCTSGTPVARPAVTIFKLNTSGRYDIVNTTGSTLDICADTSSPGTLREWTYTFPNNTYSDISTGERIGIQICMNTTTAGTGNATFQYEGATQSYVKYPIDVFNFEPTITYLVINSTRGSNTTTENITAYVNSSDLENDSVKYIYDWRINSTSIALLNMPFEPHANSSNFVLDYSTRKNNGTVINAIFNSTGGYDGKGAYNFNGIDTFINISNIPCIIPNVTSPFTISFWVYPTKPPNFARLIHFGNQTCTSRQVMVDWANSSLEATVWANRYFGETRRPIGATGIIPNNTWSFFTWTYNGSSNHTLYINGQKSVGNISTSSNTALSENYIGGRYGGIFFNGSIDEVMVYNVSLSSDEILALYQNKTDTIVSQELVLGQIWSASVTPNDGFVDGNTNLSNNLTIRARYINLTWIYPTYNINVSKGFYFNITLNATCLNVDCNVNISLYHNMSLPKYYTFINSSEDEAGYEGTIINPTNAYDNNWITYAEVIMADTGNIYTNYTIPTNAFNVSKVEISYFVEMSSLTFYCYNYSVSDWQSVYSIYGFNRQNITIPNDCMSGSKLQLKYAFEGGHPTFGDAILYEEQMWWNKSTTETYESFKLVNTTAMGNPFYTNNSNPRSITLNQDQQTNVTFWINVTGNINDVYKFYADIKVLSDNNFNASTNQYNFTIKSSSSCVYSTGNWNILCSDNCVINTNTDVGGNNISITGTGLVEILANITNFKRILILGDSPTNRCRVFCVNGGCFR